MVRAMILAWLMVLGVGMGGARGEGPAATQPSGNPRPNENTGLVRGMVTAESEVPLSEMVVYLDVAEGEKYSGAVPGEVPKVSQKGAQFSPRMLVVCAGQSVEFLNDEDRQIEHNVFSNSPTNRFDLGLYKPGESRKVLFDKAGPVFLYCSIHRYMDGVIFVSPTPMTSRVDENGKYTIANVPAGKWVVKTWQRRRRFAEKAVPVTVEAGKEASVDLELKKK